MIGAFLALFGQRMQVTAPGAAKVEHCTRAEIAEHRLIVLESLELEQYRQS